MVNYSYYENCKLEELIVEIQNTNDEFLWEIALNRTDKSIHKVFHKKVNKYYKDTMEEDIYMILKQGWIKAINTFNPEKGTAGFIAYASTLMFQSYVMFAKRITKNKTGKSVKHMLLNDVTCNQTNYMNEELSDVIIDNIVKTKNKFDDFEQIEMSDYIQDMLNKLKRHDPKSYEFITKYYLEDVTQKHLSKIHDMSQSGVSRSLKKGLSFLKKEMVEYH